MKDKKKFDRGLRVEDWLKEQRKDPEFRRLSSIEGKKIKMGMQILDLRHAAGLTQAQLAKRIGVTQGFIAQLEAAEVDNYEVKTLKRICDAIGRILVVGFLTPAELSKTKTMFRNLIPLQ
jgi:DNA-binding XRE family transcriptional regulator